MRTAMIPFPGRFSLPKPRVAGGDAYAVPWSGKRKGRPCYRSGVSRAEDEPQQLQRESLNPRHSFHKFQLVLQRRSRAIGTFVVPSETCDGLTRSPPFLRSIRHDPRKNAKSHRYQHA